MADDVGFSLNKVVQHVAVTHSIGIIEHCGYT